MRDGTPLLFASLLVLAGCSDKDTTTADTASTADLGPCGDGGWGAITDPDAALHVRSDGSDETGTGSVDAPYAGLDTALAASRLVGAQPVAVGPGSFDATLTLSDDDGSGASDDGWVLQGCGSAETTLVGTTATSVVRAVDVQDLSLAGLRIESGRRSVWLRAGTTAALSEVEIHGGLRLGLVVEGSSTLVDGVDVSVFDTAPESLSSGASMGYGVSVDGGTLALQGGEITGSTGVGVLAAFASLSLTDVTVSGTVAGADGGLGRGVQLQDLSLGVLVGGLLADNTDAGLFATRAADLQVDGLSIERTTAGAVPGTGETTGDGIVVTQGPGGSSDPADFTATLLSCVIDGTDRAAVVLDGVTAEVSDHTHLNNGLVVEGSSTFTQNDAVTSGNTPSATTADGLPLGLDHQEVALDDYRD